VVAEHSLQSIMEPPASLSGHEQKDDQSVVQKDETDWEVLEKLSRVGKYSLLVRHDYVVIADDNYLAGPEFHAKLDPNHPHKQLTLLYNAQREAMKAVNVRPLRKFAPGVGSERQRKKVDIIGWVNSGDDGEKSAKARLATKSGQIYTDIKIRSEAVETIRIQGETVHTQAQARALVDAEMERRARTLVRGDGALANGEPYLRAGQKHVIQLNDLKPFGKMFTGEYVIESVRHAINQDGVCETSFDVRRPEVSKV